MFEVIWSSEAIVKATGGQANGKFSATGISIDSRSLKEGDVFIALMGDNHDGHQYLEKAARAGATGLIISKEPENKLEIPYIVVADTLAALKAMAAFRREQSKAKIIGVTGSVGKTSVKNMLAHVLKEQGKTHASGGNFNNHIGLPLSLARMPESAQFGVFELGMNHAGELRELSKILKPNIAVVTAVEAVHLEFFDSLKNIAEAKAEIFEGVQEGGSAVVPFDTDFLPLLAGAAHKAGIEIDNISSFGVGLDAAVRLLKGSETLRWQELEVNVKGEVITYKLGLPGRHQALNSLAVLAVVKLLGLNLGKAAYILETIRPTEGRGRLYAIAVNKQPCMMLDDSYNASPASMKAALHVLKLAKGRKVAALGDMLELGDASEQLHTSLVPFIQKSGVSLVFTSGKFGQKIKDALPEGIQGLYAENPLDILPLMREYLQGSDTVLVKGSHGSQMWKLAEALRKER